MRIFSHIVNASPENTAGVAGSAEEQLPVVVNGPLSEVYTQALNHVYAKQDEVTGEIAKPSLETQANDEHAIGALIGELNQHPGDFVFKVPQTYVYATRRDLITPNSLDDLQSNIDQFEADQGASQYILVNDTSVADTASTDYMSIGEIINLDRTVETMESLVLSKGGRVVHSFADIFRKK